MGIAAGDIYNTMPVTYGGGGGNGDGLDYQDVFNAIAYALRGSDYISIGSLTPQNTLAISLNMPSANAFILQNIKGNAYITPSFNSQTGTLTLNFNIAAIINDAGTNTTQTWSSSKIASYIQSLIDNLDVLKLVGYIGNSAPGANVDEGQFWISSPSLGSSGLPTASPTDISSPGGIWNGTAWVASPYSMSDFDVWYNSNDGTTWYWLANVWHPLNFSIDLSAYRTAAEQDEIDRQTMTLQRQNSGQAPAGYTETEQLGQYAPGLGNSLININDWSIRRRVYKTTSSTISDTPGNLTNVGMGGGAYDAGTLYVDRDNRLGVVVTGAPSGNKSVMTILPAPTGTGSNPSNLANLILTLNGSALDITNTDATETLNILQKPFNPTGNSPQTINIEYNPFDLGTGTNSPGGGMVDLYTYPNYASSFTADPTRGNSAYLDPERSTQYPNGKPCFLSGSGNNTQVQYDFQTLAGDALVFRIQNGTTGQAGSNSGIGLFHIPTTGNRIMYFIGAGGNQSANIPLNVTGSYSNNPSYPNLPMPPSSFPNVNAGNLSYNTWEVVFKMGALWRFNQQLNLSEAPL